MLDSSLLDFVTGSLPAPPAWLLEVGAGDGALARRLRSDGYEVLAIDPASDAPEVDPVRLHELGGPPERFDAALAVLSMHHVEPLPESGARLAEVVRPGGLLILDEIDFDRFDERAAGWWLEQHSSPHEHADSPAEMVAHLRHHCHSLRSLEAVLGEWFELGAPARGPYLYRWELGPELRDVELELIDRGELPATGARLVGVRR